MQNLSSMANAAASGASATVVSAIRQASAKSGVDFSYLMDKAATESSFNPDAHASTSSASGLYQFIDQTWLQEMAQHGAEYGLGKQASAISVDSSGHASVNDPAMKQQIMALKNDPTAAAEMAAAFTKDNQAYLQGSIGGQIGATELYLAHFLGASGAAKFLGAMRHNGSQSGASVMPAAADANEPVFYHGDGSPRSLSEIYNRFAAKFSDAGAAGGASQSASLSADEGFIQPFTSGTAASSSLDSSSVTPTALGDTSRASLYEMMVLSQLSHIQATDGDKT